MRLVLPLLLAATAIVAAAPAPTEKLRILIVDGQNNHDWKKTTPVLKHILEASGRFTVDVATAGKNTADFRPKFADYKAVLSNYNGSPWPLETRQELEKYVKDGGGLVIVHAADNSFPEWSEYNVMIGLGGWGGRTEKSGPYLRYRDGKLVRDESPGAGGHHGRQHEFVVETIKNDHPITKGFPAKWKHASDELYDRLRGPALNLTLMAVAHSDKATGGSGENEPMIFTIDYGKGRVFHTPMGHSAESMKCVGFATVVQRGTEWAATNAVTLPVPENFPTADKVSLWAEK